MEFIRRALGRAYGSTYRPDIQVSGRMTALSRRAEQIGIENMLASNWAVSPGQVLSLTEAPQALRDSGLHGLYYIDGQHPAAQDLLSLLEIEARKHFSLDGHDHYFIRAAKANTELRPFKRLVRKNYSAVAVAASESFLWRKRFLFLGAHGSRVLAPAIALRDTALQKLGLPSALDTDREWLCLYEPQDKISETDIGHTIFGIVSKCFTPELMGSYLPDFDNISEFHGIWSFTATLSGWAIDLNRFPISFCYKVGTSNSHDSWKWDNYFMVNFSGESPSLEAITDKGDINVLRNCRRQQSTDQGFSGEREASGDFTMNWQIDGE